MPGESLNNLEIFRNDIYSFGWFAEYIHRNRERCLGRRSIGQLGAAINCYKLQEEKHIERKNK